MECAVFLEKPDEPTITVEILERDGFETSPPLFECYVAEEESENKSEDTVLVGYAVFCYAYSTWNGRKLVLQDVFVTDRLRGKGVGTKLFEEVVKHTVANKCAYMDCYTLHSDGLKEVFDILGIVNMTKTEKWDLFRLSGEALEILSIP
uniref:N-acetyltransferase domain-containing protein n=1 Tax=Homalodisca liturata TaxID=320908 RepID=A0A1B6HPT4_9HEMI